MPDFKGPVNRQSVQSVLTQMYGVKNKNSALRIKDEKGKVAIRADSAKGMFKGFAIKKQALVQKNVNGADCPC